MNETSPRSILRHVTLVLFKYKISIVVLLVFTVACFGFGTFLVTPQWRATTKLLVLQDPKQQMILFGDLESPNPVDKGTSANDLVEILTGNELAAKIVTDFELDERKRRSIQEPQTARERCRARLVQVVKLVTTIPQQLGILPASEPNWREKATDDLIEEMEDIESVQETSTISLSIWADDRDLAVGICRAMVDFLLEKTKNFDRSEAVQTYEFVTEQLAMVESALREAEDRLYQFQASENIVALDTEKALLLTRHDTLTTEFSRQETRLASLNAELAELKAQLGSTATRVGAVRATTATRSADASGASSAAPAADRYRGLGNSINEKAVEQQILGAQVEVSRVKGEYETLRHQLAEVERQRDALHDQELMLTRLLRETSGLQDRYLNLRKKQLELEVQKYTETSEFDIKVADEAYIPPGAEKDWPSWGLNLAVGLVVGVMLSVGQAFFFEYWRDTLQHPDEVAQDTGLEVFGSVGPVSLKRVCKQLTRGRSVLPVVESAGEQPPVEAVADGRDGQGEVGRAGGRIPSAGNDS